MSVITEDEAEGRLADLVRQVRAEQGRIHIAAAGGGEVVIIAREDLERLESRILHLGGGNDEDVLFDEEDDPAELTIEQGRALFDERAGQLLGMSGTEFVQAWTAGELDRDDDDVLRVALLLPLAG